MAEQASILPAGTRILDYTVEGLIGKPGHFGATYLARDGRGERIALKEFLPVELVTREGEALRLRRAEDAGIFRWGLRGFLDEAQQLTQFRHPSIVRGLAAFESNGTAYLAMEYVDGESLADLLQREGRMREVRLRSFLMPVIDAIEQAHSAGLLHRDICPADIRIATDGRPVLIDFAAARNVLRFKSKSVALAFAPGYAPIEEYQVSGKQGPWTDIYSLAAVAYRAISGQVPPEATTRRQPGPAMRPALEAGQGSYPEHFLRAVDWGLRLDTAERPQRIAEWRAALDGEREVPAFAEAQTPAAPEAAVAAAAVPEAGPAPGDDEVSPVGIPPPPRPALPRGVLWGAIAAAAVAVGAALALLGGGKGPQEQVAAAVDAASPAPSAATGSASATISELPPPRAEELSGLDRIALQMLQQDQRRQAEEEVLAAEEARKTELEARDKAAREQAALQKRLAEEQDSQRRKQLEQEQARLKAEEDARQKQAELERPATPPAASPLASGAPASAIQVAQKRPEECRHMHVSQLAGAGRQLTYADARRIRGATIDDSTGIIRLPPIRTEGRQVLFEVQPDGCARVVRG